MNIRPYDAADRQACIDIFDSNTPKYFDSAERAQLLLWLDAKDKDMLAYPSNAHEYFYVAEVDGKVLGCAGYYIPGNEPKANMVWGMVANAYHKQGIGKAMLLHRLEHAALHHPDCAIVLDTSQHTYPFFETLGFKVTAVHKDFYGPGLDRYDMVR